MFWKYQIISFFFAQLLNSIVLQFLNASKITNLILTNNIQLVSSQEFWNFIESVQSTLTTVALIYCLTFFLNHYVYKISLPYYKNRYGNVKALKRSYTRFLSHMQFTVLVNLYNFPSFLGIFVASMQYFTLGRKINILVSILNLGLGFIMTEIAMVDDRKVLAAGKKTIRIKRNEVLMFISQNEIQKDDILFLRRFDSVPVQTAQLIQEECLFTTDSINGEQNTYKRYKHSEFVYSDMKCFSGCELKTIQLYSNHQKPAPDGFTDSLIKTQTQVGLILCAILFCLMQIGKVNQIQILTIVDLCFDMISTLVVFNFLIPQMKTLPVAIVRGLLMLFYAKTKNIVLINSDEIIGSQKMFQDTQQRECKIRLICDKTGTLTENKLKVNQSAFYKAESSPWLEMILSVNSSFEFRKEFYASSPEERAIAISLKEQGLLQKCLSLDTLYDQWQVRQFQTNSDEIVELTVYTKEFDSKRCGRHSLLKLNQKSYHVVQFQAEQLSKLIARNDHQWIPLNANRSLMILYCELPSGKDTMTDFESIWIPQYLSDLKSNQISSEHKWRPVAEFYFSDPIRTNSAETIQKIQQDYPNTSVYICTGDSILTAQYIASKLGMQHSNICDGTSITDSKEIQCNDSNSYIFAKFNSTQKAQLIQRLQFLYPNDIIAMFGDHKNDQDALRVADYSFVQAEGALDCKIVSKCIVNDLQGVFNYLFHVRRLRLYGQYWLVTQFHLFNCILSGICLLGLHTQKFSKKGIVFLESWNPLASLILTNSLALTFIVFSYKIGRKAKSNDLNYHKMVSIWNLLQKSLWMFALSIAIGYCYRNFFGIESILIVVFALSLSDIFIILF